ncbi:MAG: LysM peptidoglycan-binding domain-containing protein [Actinomycetota bacterium]|nr:LysM peptidoglycan-binding domain-containing protein [Actinomycetota bacterium]
MTEETSRSWEPARAPASAPVRRPMARPSRHTYTRRRIVAALALTALVLIVWAALGLLGSAAASAPESPLRVRQLAARTYAVQPGDTFWSIAQRLGPDGDPRSLVDRLVAAHGGTELHAGEVIDLAR